MLPVSGISISLKYLEHLLDKVLSVRTQIRVLSHLENDLFPPFLPCSCCLLHLRLELYVPSTLRTVASQAPMLLFLHFLFQRHGLGSFSVLGLFARGLGERRAAFLDRFRSGEAVGRSFVHPQWKVGPVSCALDPSMSLGCILLDMHILAHLGLFLGRFVLIQVESFPRAASGPLGW